MYTIDDYSKFTKNLSKIISKRWSKVSRSSSSSLKSSNVDKQLAEEYETLIREIDYLTSEKSCYLSFINNNFTKSRSSEDLSRTLNKHSSEVLKTFIKEHKKKANDGRLLDRKDLINYVTEIVVSNHKKCNHKICSCRPKKASKEVLADNKVAQENLKETQTGNISDNFAEKSTDAKPKIDQQANQTKSNFELKKDTTIDSSKVASKTVQTDDWNHDPSCKCGCCPKLESKIDSKTLITDAKPLKDATTSDRKITASKNLMANCVGELVEEATSTKRICMSENSENSKGIFSNCTANKECSCYIQGDTCIQGKKFENVVKSKKENGTKIENETKTEKEKRVSILADTETSEESSDNKKKDKKKSKKEKKAEKENKKVSDSSASSSPRSTPKKEKKKGTTGCFGSKKKKSDCDDHCLGKCAKQKSVQTLPIHCQDKNEEACCCAVNGRKAAHTSTDMEAAIQVSPSSSCGDTRMFKQDRASFVNDKKDREGGDRFLKKRSSKANIESQNSKEKLKEAASVCPKCGRLKRECTSGCRNTFIIPCGSGNNLPTSEVESLRMIIKMQSKDTNRQFDNIMTELNHQKNEVRRLNDMYQKMLESFYDIQKSVASTRSQSKKSSDLSHECTCGIATCGKNKNLDKNQDKIQPCGCSGSNDCSMKKNQSKSAGRSNDISFNLSNSSNKNASPTVRRFGPPNTAVALNRCHVCNVEIPGKRGSKTCLSAKDVDYYNSDKDKQNKNKLNQSKKAEYLNQNEYIYNRGVGDGSLHEASSVSTLYKKDTTHKPDIHANQRNENQNMFKESGDFNRAGKVPNSFRGTVNIDVETETDSTEPVRKTRRKRSSRVLLWLRKSWVSMRLMRDDCRNIDKGKREEPAMKCMLKFCQSKAKHAATGVWKAAKHAKHFF